MIRFQKRTTSEEATVRLAADLARLLKPGDMVALIGELGAGKTRFVRGLARGLGATEHAIQSPTYVLAQEHATPSGVPLVHIDAYRLEKDEDFDTIGWDRLRPRESIVAIEWADRLAWTLPEDRLTVRMDHIFSEGGGHARRLTFEGVDVWRKRLAPLASDES